MMESSSSANHTPDSLLRNPDSKLYHPPGYGDIEERKKASEAPKLLQNQSKWELVTRIRIIFEVLILLVVVIWVITSTSSDDLREVKIFNLATTLWKTFAVTIVISRIVSYFLMWIIVGTLKICGTQTKPYLLHAIDSTLTCVIWFSIVLVAWEFIVDSDSEISEKRKTTIDNLTNGVIITAVGATFWLFKIIWLKNQTITFTGDRFFDDIKAVLFCHFIIRSILLNGTVPTYEERTGEIILGEFGKQKGKKKLWHQLPFEDWQTLSHYTVPAATLSLFAKIIRYTTLDDELEGLVISNDLGNSNSRTLNGHTAKVLADKIFDILVGRNARQSRSINLYDLEKFMPESMAQEAMKAITRRTMISRADLRRWLVTNFRKWRKLELNLSNNHAVMKNYNVILSCVVLAITTSWCLYIMNSSATKDFFTVLLAQSAILVVLLKDTVKKYSECTRFFFDKHPINVGDICWIEGDWMIVQDVKLLHSKFISENNGTLELENTSLLQQRIHVARDEDVWRQNDDDIVSSIF